MASGKGMPPEIRALLKKIGIVGVEEEAKKLYPDAVELDGDGDGPDATGLEAANETAR
jgi:hypothetical protein